MCVQRYSAASFDPLSGDCKLQLPPMANGNRWLLLHKRGAFSENLLSAVEDFCSPCQRRRVQSELIGLILQDIGGARKPESA